MDSSTLTCGYHFVFVCFLLLANVSFISRPLFPSSLTIQPTLYLHHLCISILTLLCSCGCWLLDRCYLLENVLYYNNSSLLLSYINSVDQSNHTPGLPVYIICLKPLHMGIFFFWYLWSNIIDGMDMQILENVIRSMTRKCHFSFLLHKGTFCLCISVS